MTEYAAQYLTSWGARATMSGANRQRHEAKRCLQRRQMDLADWSCDGDGCGGPMTIGSSVLLCEVCNYGLCDACVARRK